MFIVFLYRSMAHIVILTYIGHHPLLHKNGHDLCPLNGQSKKPGVLHAHELLKRNQDCNCHESQNSEKDHFSDLSQEA